MSRRGWIVLSAVVLGLAVVLVLVLRYGLARSAYHDQFDRVAAGMTEEQVREVMEPPGDYRTDRRPRAAVYAEVWQTKGGTFARGEYRGLDVQTTVRPTGERFLVWKRDEAVVIVEFDSAGQVCGKFWLAPVAP